MAKRKAKYKRMCYKTTRAKCLLKSIGAHPTDKELRHIVSIWYRRWRK